MKCDYCDKEIINLRHIIHYKENCSLTICSECALKVGYLKDYVPVMYWFEKNTVHVYTDIKQPSGKKIFIRKDDSKLHKL
jgi:ribosome-binding protein aMBF1 (putative translation factor)